MMLRYYMTPETQQALIAESNRQIANRAAMNAARRQRDNDFQDTTVEQDGEASESESAFAKLVADLQSRPN